MDLIGRKALVSGGSGGLGRQICLALAQAGCDVAVGYHARRDRADAVAAAVRETGRDAVPVRFDQSDVDQVGAAMREAVGALGGLDILVNNAAMARAVPFPDLDALTDDLWRNTMETNLAGPWRLARAAAPHLRAARGGRIVNVAAMAGMKPMGASIAQSVSKAGVIQLTRCLAVALAPDITVNCVAPGLMLGTELTRNVPDFVREGFARQAVLGTTTSLADVAGQVVQFCRSDTVTGQTAVIDGGVFFH